MTGRLESANMVPMRGLLFLLAACKYTAPDPLTGDGPDGDGSPATDVLPLGDPVRVLDIVDDQVTGGPHADFPLLVTLTEPYLRDAANGGDVLRADGFDLYFSGDQAGTSRLAHEVENYDPMRGALVAWIKVPSLSASTVIYLHYGSAEITTSQENVAAVWSAGYAVVLHLDGNADATGHATGVDIQTTSVVDTPIDRGHTFDAVDDRVIVTSPTIDDIFATGGTAEGWFFALGYGENGFGRIWDKGHTNGWSMAINNGNATRTLAFVHGDSTDFGEWNGPSDAVALDGWHHAAIVYDKRSPANLMPLMYVDGMPLQNVNVFDAASGTMDSDAAAMLMAGNRGSGDRTFDGTLDELRMSNVVRSPDWIATQFANQAAPSAFYVLGDPL